MDCWRYLELNGPIYKNPADVRQKLEDGDYDRGGMPYVLGFEEMVKLNWKSLIAKQRKGADDVPGHPGGLGCEY
jgi:hypothetical protein